ncbi:MAG: TraR/DksA family transcriptional regulator [Phycisphaeraceae bacterium]
MAKKTSKASATSPSSSKKTTKKKVTKKKTAKKATASKTATTAKTTKKAASPATADGQAESKTKTKPVKSGLTKREIQKYRAMLLIKRAEIRGDMDSMQAEALLNHDSANLSHMPIHMADVGSDQYEQELTLGLVESERRLLNEIEEALYRIQEGTYGVCEESGVPINKARLDAKPWAKYTIEVAREMERTHPNRR